LLLLEDDKFEKNFNLFIDRLYITYKQGGRLYIAGNGGSASDAQHFAAELVCRLKNDRDPIPAECLNTDTSVLTSIANDYGYENIFSRQIKANVSSNDLFLAISTSGESQNIFNAIKMCNDLKVHSVLLTGPSGGCSKTIADIVLNVPGSDAASIQEIHIVVIHALCECIENFFINDKE